ncbi:MAG TPA: pilin [Candidatus Saccharimonadales bacterium]|nr:pilin [Candidatus Saccharimonadales bacterium]
MRKLCIKLFIVAALLGGVFAVVQPAQPAAAFMNPFTTAPGGGGTGGACKAGGSFFGFSTWYKYLKGQNITDSTGKSVCRPYIAKPAEIWLIVAALFEDLLYVAGLTAVGVVIWGGFQYMLSQGEPGRISSAKSTITNAIIGLVLTVLSAKLVGFIANQFKGTPDATVGLPSVAADAGALHTILTSVFELAGAVAVIFVIWGGVTYARSDGDPGTIKQAKDTILYALIGLAVAVFAQGIVQFALSKT